MAAEDAITLTEPVPQERALFDRLAAFYAYDFSEVTGGALRDDGTYPAHECFDLIWTDPDRHARLIRVAGEVAGFVIVHRFGPAAWDMEQFFVLRKFRRRGVGRAAAVAVFETFRGQWTVEQITANIAAQAFWRRVILDYTKGDYLDTLGEDPEQSFVS